MNENEAFSHEPDRELGAVLRAALTAGDDEAFVQTVMARLAEPQTSWDVLGGWVRPGLAAALFLTAAAGVWLGQADDAPSEPIAVEEALTPAAGNGTMTALINAERPPAIDVLFAASSPDE